MSLRSRRAADPGVELRLDHDAARGQVQPAREPQQRGHLRLAAAGLEHGDPAELVLHQAGQRHRLHSPSNICANAPASRRGSWRGDPSPMARSASTSRPPSSPAAFSSSALVPSHRAAVREHHVHRQVRRMVGQHLQVRVRGEPLRLSRLRRQVQRDQPAAPGWRAAPGQLGHQQVRQHAGEPGARPEHHPVRRPDRLHCLGAGGRVRGDQ